MRGNFKTHGFSWLHDGHQRRSGIRRGVVCGTGRGARETEVFVEFWDGVERVGDGRGRVWTWTESKGVLVYLLSPMTLISCFSPFALIPLLMRALN